MQIHVTSKSTKFAFSQQFSIFFWPTQVIYQTSSLMAHTHCMGPGPGQEQGTGPGTMGFYTMLCNVHTTQWWDRDREPLFSIVPIPFSVPVLVPCSVYEPLLRQVLLTYKLTSMWIINFTYFMGFIVMWEGKKSTPCLALACYLLLKVLSETVQSGLVAVSHDSEEHA